MMPRIFNYEKLKVKSKYMTIGSDSEVESEENRNEDDVLSENEKARRMLMEDSEDD